MVSFNGHFDGRAFVPDEPVDLPAGRRVRILVEPPVDRVREPATVPPSRSTLFGACAGMFVLADDFDEPLEEFAGYRP